MKGNFSVLYVSLWVCNRFGKIDRNPPRKIESIT